MMRTTANRAFFALLLAVALAAFPAIYALARADPSSGGGANRMMGGCGEMMNDGMADHGSTGSGMMGGSMMGGGGVMSRMMGDGMMNGMTGGGERPNQQWRR
jgi:hypothetical protein